MLECRVFQVTLENIGPHTLRLGQYLCGRDDISVQEKKKATGWEEIGGEPDTSGNCKGRRSDDPASWRNTTLGPGEHLVHIGRLLEQGDPTSLGPYDPGPHRVRVSWRLFGCTQAPEHPDCLRKIEIVPSGATIPLLTQHNVPIVSAEFVVSAPPIPKLAIPQLAITVMPETVLPGGEVASKNSELLDGKCTTKTVGSIDCIILHVKIRNRGDRPVMIGHEICGDISMWPQFKLSKEAQWKFWAMEPISCSMSYMVWDTVLPGETLQQEITLRYFSGSVYQVREAGTYIFRLQYSPEVCLMDSGANICLTKPDSIDRMFSPPFELRTTRTLPKDTGF